MNSVGQMPIQFRPTVCILALLMAFLVSGTVDACPTCKDALAQDANAAHLVRGYGWSIIFMMSAPFLILAGIGGYFYYEIRKAHMRPGRSPAGALTEAPSASMSANVRSPVVAKIRLTS